MTIRVPRRRVAHLTRPGYRAGNSDEGDQWAKDHGFIWVDRDVIWIRISRRSPGRVAANQHWRRRHHDLFGRGLFALLTLAQYLRLTSTDGYRARTVRRALRRAKKLGLRVELEAKEYATADEWAGLAQFARMLWGDDWTAHVNVKALTTLPGWQQVLHEAHTAGFPTIALCRGQWRTRRINKPWITYTRGNIRTPKEK